MAEYKTERRGGGGPRAGSYLLQLGGDTCLSPAVLWPELVQQLQSTSSCSFSSQVTSLCNPMDCSLPGSSVQDSLGKNTGVGCRFLLQLTAREVGKYRGGHGIFGKQQLATVTV